MQRRPIQFGMTALTLVICCAAAIFGLVRASGVIATGLIVVAVTLAVIAIFARVWSRVVRFALGCIALPILWFAGVDWTWTQEHCECCLLHRDIMRYRVFGWCVHEQVNERFTWLGKTAKDLGAPCSHPRTWTWNRHRFWGLLICGLPCENGICCLSADESWYDADASRVIQAWAAADPALPEEYSRRVLYERDLEDDFARQFFSGLQAALHVEGD